MIVGKYAEDIAKMAGFEVPKGTVILAAECKEVGVNEPLTREKLSPVLAVLKSTSTEDGIEKSRQMVEFNGLGTVRLFIHKMQMLLKNSVKWLELVVLSGILHLHSVVLEMYIMHSFHHLH